MKLVQNDERHEEGEHSFYTFRAIDQLRSH